MKKLVIIPGGFHPFHAGHMALYNAAVQAFPSADIYIAATADTSNRPFPFEVKQKLARIAGVPPHRFIQVKSPFQAREITQHYDPADTQLIFVRSEKDRDENPQPGGVKKNGEPAYLQPYKRRGIQPMNQHGYMAYLPTVQFGPGMSSATEIRSKWPGMRPEQKLALVKQLYPAAAQRDDLAGVVVKMLDHVMGEVNEGLAGAALGGLAGAVVTKTPSGAMTGAKLGSAVQDQFFGTDNEDEVDEATLVNDPDSGHLIQPDGGMGTWDEKSLVSNLARKFADVTNMIKNKDYSGVHSALYTSGAVANIVKALVEYERFMKKQGNRPLASGKVVDLSMNEVQDYVDESR